MLFLTDAIFDAKEKLMDELEAAPDDGPRVFAQILELDPHDHFALMQLAALKVAAEDRAGAQELLWRAVEAQPAAWAPYQQLAYVLTEDDKPLADGLLELACRKLLRDDVEPDQLENQVASFQWSEESDLPDRTPPERIEELAYALRAGLEVEPPDVTARLLQYRMIDQLLEADALEKSLVDDLRHQGASIVPLLMGVLRGWVRGEINEDNVAVMENSLALLGETATATAIREILELTSMEEPDISGPCGWALDAIGRRHTEEAARVFEKIAPDLDAGERVGVVERLVHNLQLDPGGITFERLFENLEEMEKEQRDTCFQIMLPAAVVMRGQEGLDAARQILRRYGSQISRPTSRECEVLLNEFAAMTELPRNEPEPSKWNAYQICNKEVDWVEEMGEQGGEDEEEAYYPSEPLRKPVRPERNDPCWCGSGKKYKKCHLDADETAARQAN